MHREGRGHGRGGRKQLLPHTALQKITVCPCRVCGVRVYPLDRGALGGAVGLAP